MRVLRTLFLLVMFGCSQTNIKDEYIATIKKVWGPELMLSNEQHVWLVGAYVPDSRDVNYSPELWEGIRRSLEGKEVKIKVVVKKHPLAYPQLDLVKVFLDDNSISFNEQLLISGEAFFHEDYWNKEEKEYFRQLEETAKKNHVGLWKNKDRLAVLLVRHKNWRFAYAPECKYAKDIHPDDRVEYYVPLPDAPRQGILTDTDCAEPNSSVFAPESNKGTSPKVRGLN